MDIWNTLFTNSKTQLIKYFKATNHILKEINSNYDNYRKQLLLLPETIDFSKKTFKVNDMYIHKHMILPCISNPASDHKMGNYIKNLE